MEPVLSALDWKLVNIWRDLGEFCRAANIASSTNRNLDPDLYQEVMISVFYRLMRLKFPQGSIDEVLRLGLLAFSTTIFLGIRGIPMQYDSLVHDLVSALRAIDQSVSEIPSNLSLWLAYFARVMVFHEPEQAWLTSHLKDQLQSSNLSSCQAVRSLLKSLLWVDCLHDESLPMYCSGLLPEQILISQGIGSST